MYSLSSLYSDRNDGGFDDWSSWFRKGVVRWLSIASDKAEARINKALEMDEVNIKRETLNPFVRLFVDDITVGKFF